MSRTRSMLEHLGAELAAAARRRGLRDPGLVGIHTGGVWVAEWLQCRLFPQAPLGTLDVAFHRDDFTRVGMQATVRPTDIPFDVDDRDLILVDDVLYTGRTVRAALDNVFQYGRPRSVLLAVLVDRGGRELPICADAVGGAIELAPGESVKLSGPEPLELTIVTAT